MNTSLAKKNLQNFDKLLFDNSLDGYNQIFFCNSKKDFKIITVKSKDLFKNFARIIEEVEESERNFKNIYVQINTTYIPVRTTQNIRQFRAFYIDLDNQENNECQCSYEVWELSQKGIIPEPSFYVASGRGVHIYWIIEHAPKQAQHSWQEIEDYLYNKLKYLGADKKATDSVRLLRVPGTMNPRNNSMCRIIGHARKIIKYSMYDLLEEFIKPNQVVKRAMKTKTNSKVINNKLFNAYSLHMTRIEDLTKLLKLRNFDIEGYRNAFVHLYAYWKGIYVRDLDRLKEEVIEFNNSFKKPLKLNEINSIVRSVDRAIDKFLEYQDALHSGENKRISKAMIERGGYWYTNERLIEMLDITDEEQPKLKTIIGTDEKYKRNNLKRTPRNEEGLTKKQAELKETYIKAKALYDKGLSKRAIGRNLNITETKVRELFKKFSN